MNPIRKYFKPYQPSIEYTNQPFVAYQESQPCTELQDFIYCFWRLNTTQKLDNPFMYRVVSDGCIDILFEQSTIERIFITGFSTKFIEYDLSHSFDYIGIRFLPTGFPVLFDISANILTNQFLPLQEISASLYSEIKHEVTEKMTLPEATKAFNALFTKLLNQRETPPEIDSRLLTAIRQILEARGYLNITELDVGVSERQLRRLFGHYFGDSAKTFAKIIRFQNILDAKPSPDSLKKDKIFYNEGYYDQAHFIKEFKAFYGVTPSRAFGR